MILINDDFNTVLDKLIEAADLGFHEESMIKAVFNDEVERRVLEKNTEFENQHHIQVDVMADLVGEQINDIKSSLKKIFDAIEEVQ